MGARGARRTGTWRLRWEEPIGRANSSWPPRNGGITVSLPAPAAFQLHAGHDQRKYPYGVSDHCAGEPSEPKMFPAPWAEAGRELKLATTNGGIGTEKIRSLTKRSAEDARHGREEKTFAVAVGQVEEPERRLCDEREGTAPRLVQSHGREPKRRGLS